MNPPTPAIVTQSAARPLPRLVLVLFCLAYVLSGFLGREPWKNADVAALGYMYQLAQGHTDWLAPTLLGQPPEFDALLPYWLGAWAMQLAPPGVALDFAARLPFMALLAVALIATWQAVHRLAAQPGAQPVPFAFGGEAHPSDYARTLADASVLALIACLGLAQLSHETTPALAQLGFTALAFSGLAAVPGTVRGAGAALAVGVLGLALSGAPALAVLLPLGGAALLVANPAQRRAAAASLALAAAAALLAWALHAWHWRINLGERDWRSLGRLLLWFTWPVWPLVLWTLWRWRRRLHERHLALPLWFALVPLAATVATPAAERSLLLALPGLAALTAFALPTFNRTVSALIDWFTLLFFSGCALVVWVVWLSLQTGIPAKPAANVARLAPGFELAFSWLAFVVALAATLAWAWLVRWRTGRHRQAIWKSLVLPAGGAALCWLLVMTLWLPALDYARSYATVVRAVVQHVGTGRCVEAVGLSQSQMGALVYHGPVALRQPAADGGSTACGWRLVGQSGPATGVDPAPSDAWVSVALIARPTDAKEILRLYRAVR